MVSRVMRGPSGPALKRTRRRGRPALRAGGLVIGLVALIVGVAPYGLAQDAELGLRVLGPLPEPDERGDIVAFDTQGERMFYAYQIEGGVSSDHWLRVYDLAEQVPAPVADVFMAKATQDVGGNDLSSNAYDQERDVLYRFGHRLPPTGSPGQGGFSIASEIRRIDLSKLTDDDPEGQYSADDSRIDRVWDLHDMGAPGFRARAMTYAPEDDRIYLLGRYEPLLMTTPTSVPQGATGATRDITVVLAFDLEDEEIAWQRVVHECPAPGQFGTSRVSQVARATERDALYFFCTPGGGGTVGAVSAEAYPGEPGVVRLGLGDQPEEATQADADGFPVEYFPVSGEYGTESAATVFDPATDRLFVTSLSDKTPGPFVFDGRLSAWVGKIAVPSDRGDQLAVAAESGRLYVGGGFPGVTDPPDDDSSPSSFLTVTDARATPPPQGTTYGTRWEDGLDWSESVTWSDGDPKSRDLPTLWGNGGDLTADPTTNRIFYVSEGSKKDRSKTDCELAEEQGIDPEEPDEECSEDNPPETPPERDTRFPMGIWVLEDTTPLISEGDPVDYDALTADVPEGPDTFRTFNGSTSGFGSLVRLVGGVEDFASYHSGVSNFVSGTIETVFQPNNGDRSVTNGLVRFTNLSAFGSSAEAQALRADQATSGDLAAAQQPDPPEEAEPVPEPPEQVAPDPQSVPWQPVECSDGGSEPVTKEKQDAVGAGQAGVTCDLSGELVTAQASHRAGTTEPDADLLTMAASHFDTEVHRDPDLGIVTTSVATANGINVPLPGVGTVQIGHVQATAATVAAGRTGTSAARWTRVVEGVRIFDADGNQKYPPAEGSAPTSCATVVTSENGDMEQVGSCRQLIDDLNTLLQTQMQFRLGTPDLEATPKGAYAQVWETEAEFVNGQTVMGDDSRAVPALEAVVFADGTEKSRLVIQLAGVKADSLYTITDFSLPEGSHVPDDATPDDTQTTMGDGQTAGPSETQDTVTVADLTGSGDGDGGQSTGPVQVGLPAQPVAADAPASEGAGAETPAVAPANSEPARGPLALLTLPGLHAARIFGVWALFAAAFVVAGRRGLLLQTTTGGNS